MQPTYAYNVSLPHIPAIWHTPTADATNVSPQRIPTIYPYDIFPIHIPTTYPYDISPIHISNPNHTRLWTFLVTYGKLWLVLVNRGESW